MLRNSTNFPGRYTILRAFGTYLYVVGVPAALDVEVGVGGDGEHAGPAVDDEVVLGAGVDVEAQLLVAPVRVGGLEAGDLGASPRVLRHAGLVVGGEELWPLREVGDRDVVVAFVCMLFR